MSRRLATALLCLLLLVTQQWGTLHLLGHALHAPAVAATATAEAPGEPHHPTLADAGDALCQVCLVLATLGAAGLPALWRWLVRAPRAAAPAALPRPAALRHAPAPWLARGPPALH